jgi:hypothetical protein
MRDNIRFFAGFFAPSRGWPGAVGALLASAAVACAGVVLVWFALSLVGVARDFSNSAAAVTSVILWLPLTVFLYRSKDNPPPTMAPYFPTDRDTFRAEQGERERQMWPDD